jgi:hypothetical protein
MVCRIIEVTGALPAGKELVIEFSGPINGSATLQKVTEWANKIMNAVAGKNVYIEDGYKLVVEL